MPEKTAAFTATADVRMENTRAAQADLAHYFSEFGTVEWQGASSTIALSFGTLQIRPDATHLVVHAAAGDESSLGYLKLALAERLLAFAGPSGPRIVWRGHDGAGRALPYFREMRVIRRSLVTPHMQRLTLTGPDIGRFAVNGLHVRLLIPRTASSPMPWPVMGEDGRPSRPADAPRPFARAYTIRRIDVDAGEIDIDFVLHEGTHTPGANFARAAQIGDAVGMTGPGGGNVAEADWYLLAGDETALPAIARILENLPPTACAIVKIEIAEDEERQPLLSAARLDVHWLTRRGRAAGTTKLLADAVREIDWPGDHDRQFAWVACEHRAFQEIRTYLRDTRGLQRHQHLCAAYWRRGFSES
jgi:NADPH-dependent ferric siderophore reductase